MNNYEEELDEGRKFSKLLAVLYEHQDKTVREVLAIARLEITNNSVPVLKYPSR